MAKVAADNGVPHRISPENSIAQMRVIDAAFEGPRQAGGTVDQIGIPIEPGTACWTGRLGKVQVLGLASCELFGRPGAVNLLLPRLLLGEPLTKALIARLAAGGLVESLPVHRQLS